MIVSFFNQCQVTNIICKTKITSNLRNHHWKIYYGTSEGKFKQRYGNHKKLFNHEKYRTDTELPKRNRRIKELKVQPQVQFYILRRCRLTKRIGNFYSCLNKNLCIIEHQGSSLLNQINELISKCRHQNKFNLRNHKSWSLCKKCLCSELVRIISRIWIEYGHLQSKSSYSLRMWRNTG